MISPRGFQLLSFVGGSNSPWSGNKNYGQQTGVAGTSTIANPGTSPTPAQPMPQGPTFRFGGKTFGDEKSFYDAYRSWQDPAGENPYDLDAFRRSLIYNQTIRR